MNSKVIFIFSALFACTCATKVASLTFWDHSTGNLVVDATLAITLADGQLQGVVSNLRFLKTAGVHPDRVYEPFKWTLTYPLEHVVFKFTYAPSGLFNVTSPERASKSAKNFAYLIVQALAQGTFIESFYAKGERPQAQNVYSFFGLCEPKNLNNMKVGNDFVLSFDINPYNCSMRIPSAPWPHPENRERRKILFAGGKVFTKTLLMLKFVENCVTHNVGIRLMIP